MALDFDLTLRGYRCFPIGHEVRFRVSNGLIAFVGPNNAGKSAVLKSFFELRPLLRSLLPTDNNFLVVGLGGSVAAPAWPLPVSEPIEPFSNLDHSDIEIEIQLRVDSPEPTLATRLLVRVSRPPVFQVTTELEGAAGRLGQPGQEVRQEGEQIGQGEVSLDGAAIYEVLRALTRCLYIGPFRNAINVGSQEDYFDISIGEAFIAAWRRFKTGPSKEDNEAAVRVTEDIRQLLSFESLDINPAEDGRTLQLFIDGKSFRLPEVGAGLAHFILVLVNVATKNPTYVLVDEPELNLHPSLQLSFLTTLASYGQAGTLFATHSLGLARSAADDIYSVVPASRGRSDIRPFEGTNNYAELLGELSFAGYSDLGFDSVLLVEGRTDVKVIQNLLRHHGKDGKVVLLPLGGEALINGVSEQELGELTRLGASLFALIDSERSASGETLSPGRQKFVEACEQLGIDCTVLERRATENYFPERALKAALGPTVRALSEFETIKESGQTQVWSKNQNWRVAREMVIEDLDETDLGALLERL